MLWFVCHLTVKDSVLGIFTMAGDHRPTILGLSIVFPIIAIASVFLRFEARRINRVKLGADDWTILAALVKTPSTADMLDSTMLMSPRS